MEPINVKKFVTDILVHALRLSDGPAMWKPVDVFFEGSPDIEISNGGLRAALILSATWVNPQMRVEDIYPFLGSPYEAMSPERAFQLLFKNLAGPTEKYENLVVEGEKSNVRPRLHTFTRYLEVINGSAANLRPRSLIVFQVIYENKELARALDFAHGSIVSGTLQSLTHDEIDSMVKHIIAGFQSET